MIQYVVDLSAEGEFIRLWRRFGFGRRLSIDRFGRGRCGRARSPTKALVQTQLGIKKARTIAVVDGNDLLAGLRVGIEGAVRGVEDLAAGAIGCREAGAIVVLRIAVEVVAYGDVEGLVGGERDEEVGGKTPRQFEIGSVEEAGRCCRRSPLVGAGVGFICGDSFRGPLW